MPAKNQSSVLSQLQKLSSQRVKVAVTDIDGILRGKYLHKDKFLAAADGGGFGFCNVVFGWDSSDVCYDNTKHTGWHTGYPDDTAQVDLSTFRTIPWDDGTPFFLADFGHEVCPRSLLRRILERAEKAGVLPLCGMEFEWFNFRETPQSLAAKNYSQPEPLSPGMFGYSILRSSQNQPYFKALMEELLAFGVPLEGLHTETGPGVFEAAILYSEALEAADRAVLFKSSAKEIGHRFGIMPSFMAKWNPRLPGCSGHLHLSLWDRKKSKNLFYDASDAHRMSTTYKHFLAGMIQLLPEVLPFFAPTVNSYKRLVDGYWAPTMATWGVDNRTTAFRVIPGSPKSTRLEVRVTGSDVNPYLAIAASLACGLYGIEKKLELREKPIVGSAYAAGVKGARLPRTLQEATKALSSSTVAREILGNDFVEHFVQTRLWEWRQFQDAVTDWERQRYFEII